MSAQRLCHLLLAGLLVGCGQESMLGRPVGMPILVPGQLSTQATEPGLYAFESPKLTLQLPSELREISDLSVVDATTVAAIQDESGALYWIDVSAQTPIRRIVFASQGDYEGLAKVHDEFYALRSDGLLSRWKLERGEWRTVAQFQLETPHLELEGLCLDITRKTVGQRLLFAPKDRSYDEEDSKDERPIYAFDLQTSQQLPDPVLVLSRKRLIADAERLGRKLPERTTKKGKQKVSFKLRISALAVHPFTEHLYVLSGPDRTLFVVDHDGNLIDTHVFDEATMPQPEGLAFAPNGDLWICSEGVQGNALMQLFANPEPLPLEPK